MACLYKCSPLVVLLLLGLACKSIPTRDDYQSQIATLEARLQADSTDGEALQKLGVIYVSTQRFNEGKAYLERARGLQDEEDSITLSYLGRAHEALSDTAAALEIYARYPQASGASRKYMERRFRILSRLDARSEIRKQIAQESSLGTDHIDPDLVGVFPLTYLGNRDDRYASLGRGLSELIMNDLYLVNVRLVERIRLPVLIAEIELAVREPVDQRSAPRAGILLGAGKVVVGAYNVLDDRIQPTIFLSNTQTSEILSIASGEDELNNVISLEKKIVFDLLEKLEIELTPEDSTRIHFVPTRSLAAFLAFSQGLVEEDNGQLSEAKAHFEQAQRLDPDFELATEKVEAVDTEISVQDLEPVVSIVAPPVEEQPVEEQPVEEQPVEEQPVVVTTPVTNPVGSRLENMGGSIGSGFISNPDTDQASAEAPADPSAGASAEEPRNPIEEAAGSDSQMLGLPEVYPLPRPPDPPKLGAANRVSTFSELYWVVWETRFQTQLRRKNER